MPRPGHSTADVVAAGAQLADDVGFHNVAMGSLAQRLGVSAPSLYKHVEGLADLQRAIATLTLTELGDALRDALQGRAGTDAMVAFAKTYRSYIVAHPGRYASTITLEFTGPDDPLYKAAARIVDSITAALHGYGIPEADMDHALRTVRCAFHGFASLQTSDGFRWTGDPDASFEWMVLFLDRGLRALAGDP